MTFFAGRSTVLSLLFVFFVTTGIWGMTSPLQADALPQKLYDSLAEPDFSTARQLLEEHRGKPVVPFWLGWIAFQQEDYSRSYQHFQEALAQLNSDNPRYRDTLYFLDRMKLYHTPSATVPTVRVQIIENQTRISGSANKNLVIRNEDGKNVASLSGRWRAEIEEDSVLITSGSERLARGNRFQLSSENSTINFEGKSYRGTLWIRAGEGRLNLLNELALNEYLYGVVKKELSAGWPMAMVRAQAVAARSFALYQILRNQDKAYDLSSSWLSQVYGGASAETPRIRKGVDQTKGEILTYRGRIVPAYFHANSGGHIESPARVWGGEPTPFVRPRADTWSLETKHASWETTLSRETFVQKLVQGGYPEPESGSISLQVQKFLPSGRAKILQYASKQGTVRISANDFRIAIGPERIKSSWFDQIRETNNQFRFQGRGWGHGVGMSQWGGRAMAEAGHNYREILSFYFAPTKVVGQYGPTHLSANPNP